jgi:hypothetical protein
LHPAAAAALGIHALLRGQSGDMLVEPLVPEPERAGAHAGEGAGVAAVAAVDIDDGAAGRSRLGRQHSTSPKEPVAPHARERPARRREDWRVARPIAARGKRRAALR